MKQKYLKNIINKKIKEKKKKGNVCRWDLIGQEIIAGGKCQYTI